MKSKTKKVYETPQLTVVSFRTERGYASSGVDPVEQSFFLGFSSSSNGNQSLESRSDGGYWGGDSWF